MTNYKHLILQEENEFPRLFADVCERDWGVLFFRTDNKNSHDSNHAILYPDKVVDLGMVLDEIKRFYLTKGIEPRLYLPFEAGYYQNNKNIFEQGNWDIELYENQIMILTESSSINVSQRLDIRRLNEWDDKITSVIYQTSESEYEVEVDRRSLTHENYYLFVGYLDNIPVVLVSLHISAIGCTRFDYIETAPKYRGKGYGREILHYVTNYCRQHQFPLYFQWPANGTSAKICYEAGFRNDFMLYAGSAVFKPKEAMK